METDPFFKRIPAREMRAVMMVMMTATGLQLAYGPNSLAQQSLNDPSFQPGIGADKPVNGIIKVPDGRILVGGEFTSFNNTSNAYLVRLYPDGSIDPGFSAQGLTDGPVTRMQTQSDGTVLVAGTFNNLSGVPRRGLGRLAADGTVDLTFDPLDLIATYEAIYAIAEQADGQILIAATASVFADTTSRILRLQTNGLLDNGFNCTISIEGFVHALLPQPNGAILFGGGIYVNGDTTRWGLFELKSTGELDLGFDAGLSQYSTVFSLARKPDGRILVGGVMLLPGSHVGLPLAQLDGKEWDLTFTSDFDGIAQPNNPGQPYITTLQLQPDGKLVAGGSFFQVGGYWRRQILRLDLAGHVDPCFDPGLGLGGNAPGAVRTLSLSQNGSLLAGGEFYGCDLAYGQNHIAKLLPHNDCGAVRVYLSLEGFVAATFPPGITNVLETSFDLRTWEPMQTTTDPYIFVVQRATEPQQFFRARQIR